MPGDTPPSKSTPLTREELLAILQLNNESLATSLVTAFRLVMEPAAPPTPELVTVGETSDPELDRRVLCAACLGERGSRWSPHKTYSWGVDPKRPGIPMRQEHIHDHPEVKKSISYDARGVREGLERGTHGSQCIQCGGKLQLVRVA